MDREKIISKLEKEVQRTYSIKTTVFQNGEKVSEEINTHREPSVRIPIEMADKILAILKEQEAWIEQIADYQQSITGSGMHELTEYEQGKWDGLQIAWNIISEGR